MEADKSKEMINMEDLSVPVGIRLPKELVKHMKKVAKVNRTSLSYVMKMALLDVYPMKEAMGGG